MHCQLLDHQNPLFPTLDSPEPMLVCLLGGFRLLRCGQPIDLPIAGKAMTLVAELALRLDEGVPREELLEALWPEQDFAQATVSLNSLIYSLQRRLRDELEGGAALVYANGAYALNKAAGVSTDIARFDAQVRRGARLAITGDEAAASRAFAQAVDLYRGDLTAGTHVCAVIERERLRARYLGALAWLADHAYRAGDDETALEHALRLLKYDPCREDAHRMVMRIRVERGERSVALRHYRICEQVLRHEFDAAPERATRELFDQIRIGSAPA